MQKIDSHLKSAQNTVLLFLFIIYFYQGQLALLRNLFTTALYEDRLSQVRLTFICLYLCPSVFDMKAEWTYIIVQKYGLGKIMVSLYCQGCIYLI